MLIMLSLEGSRFADEYVNNPLIIDNPKLESLACSTVQAMLDVNENCREHICGIARAFQRGNGK